MIKNSNINDLKSLILMLGVLGGKIDNMLEELTKIEKIIQKKSVLLVDAHDG